MFVRLFTNVREKKQNDPPEKVKIEKDEDPGTKMTVPKKGTPFCPVNKSPGKQEEGITAPWNNITIPHRFHVDIHTHTHTHTHSSISHNPQAYTVYNQTPVGFVDESGVLWELWEL